MYIQYTVHIVMKCACTCIWACYYYMVVSQFVGLSIQQPWWSWKPRGNLPYYPLQGPGCRGVPVGGVQDVQCAQLLPWVAQEAHAARTHQGGEGYSDYVCTSTCVYSRHQNFFLLWLFYCLTGLQRTFSCSCVVCQHPVWCSNTLSSKFHSLQGSAESFHCQMLWMRDLVAQCVHWSRLVGTSCI